MIIYFYGNRGKGKTLSSVILTDLLNKFYNKQKKKCVIFSNVDMQLKEYDITEFFNKEFQNDKLPKIFLFDEIDKFGDARVSNSVVNRFISYSVSLSRKTNTDYIFTAQIYKSLDFRLRKFTDFVIAPELNKKTYMLKWDMFNQGSGTSKTIAFKHPVNDYYKKYDTHYLTLDLIAEYMPKFKELSKQFGSKK